MSRVLVVYLDWICYQSMCFGLHKHETLLLEACDIEVKVLCIGFDMSMKCI